MDWTQIIVGILSSLIVAGLGKWLNVKVDDSNRQKLDWALERGVALAAERFRGAPNAGEAKKRAALETAKSLAPKALERLDEELKSALVDATYARMRASLPTTAWVAHGDALSHQVEDLGGVRPLPRPAPLPLESLDKTSAERPGSKR